MTLLEVYQDRMDILSESGRPLKLAGGRWVMIPTVSVGNVPQLAVDLLVNTRGDVVLGHVMDPNMVPVCGNGGPGFSISTGCEVFDLGGKGYALLPRAPPAPGRAAAAAKDLADLIQSHGVAEIFLLASSYAGGRRDAQLGDSSRLRYMVTTPALKFSEKLRAKGIPVMEGGGDKGWVEDLQQIEKDINDGTSGAPAFIASQRRSSFLRRLLEECDARGIALCVLLMFVFEGDNSVDAMEMAAVASEVTGLSTAGEELEWKIPSSWQKNLGGPPESMLY